VVKPTLAIAVLTFRRPAPLADLIPLLIEQARTVSDEAAAYVLVVDNDPDRSAESMVAEFADQGVVYANEPEPGIATARNRGAMAAAVPTSSSSSTTMKFQSKTG
jgi:glycosyltransferase involved in cell wall biosynthesis